MAEGSQNSRQFAATSGRLPAVGSQAEAPSVNTTPYRVSQPQLTNKGAAMSAIGTALGSFFNTAAQTVNKIADIDAYEERAKIERENQNIALQGAVDHKAGRPMAPEYANRQAYAGAYQQSAADAQAFALTQKFKEHLAALPRDGTQDPTATAEAFWQSEVGHGTGDRDFDSRLMGAFMNSARQMVAQADTQRLDDQERTATNTIIQAQTAKLQAQGGFTVGNVADMRGQLLTVTNGDVTRADKLMVAIMGTAQNERQALSFLNALDSLPVGTDAEGKPVTWAARNAEAYQRMSEQALHRVTQVKTIQAYNEVSQWQTRAAAIKGDPNATADDFMGLVAQGVDIDARHGVGKDKFNAIDGDIRAFLKQKANVNRYFMALTGQGTNGSHFGIDAVNATGGKVMTELEQEQGIAMAAQQLPGFEDLAASAQQTGLVNPQYSDAAMLQTARLLASRPNQEAMMGEAAPKSLRVKMFGALGGQDVKAAARAFRGAQELERQGVTDGLLSKFFPDANTEQWYRSLKANGVDGQDTESSYADFLADPRSRDAMAQGEKSAYWNLPQFAGKHGTEAADFQKKVDKGLMMLGRQSAGREGWFFNKDVGMDSMVRSEIEGLLRKDFAIQRRRNGSIDLDAAFKNIGPTIEGRYLLIPSQSGALQLVKNQFDTRGQTVGDPLNANPNSPVSRAKGYPPIYAGVPMKNALGQREDPHATMSSDLEALARALPSAFPDTKAVWTNRPDDNGLMLLKTRGMPVQFAVGQTIDVPGTVTTPDKWTGVGTYEAPTVRKETVPSDPREAQKFFQRILPPGFIAVPSGIDGAYQLHYGFRLLGDKERADAAAKAAETAIDKRNDASADRQQFLHGTTTEGGAAIRFRKPF
ncbi:hypothetical protein [Xylophilus sp.]|uniref:hypothetical protein n=1 Tax=Xylophilus sp. TaxID=2653893 RepID=UPI0013BCFACC|nr:hypothetical protein [Xylophilus sp.]KAF1049327.1 MAG: hypothetical protein GAK38_00783 [Xylophilus sp.]